jgi:hypothetical protein
MFVTGTAGRVEGEEIETTRDGRFELPVRLRRPAPPYGLEVRTTRDPHPRGCLRSLPLLEAGRHYELGDLALASIPRLCSGTVKDDLGQPIEGATVVLERFFPAAGERGQFDAEAYVAARTDAAGAFELIGEERPGPLRLRASAGGHEPAHSDPITIGATIALVLDRSASLSGAGRLPDWLPADAVRVQLLANGRTVRDERVRGREGDRFEFRLTSLAPGDYELVLLLRGMPRPLVMVRGVDVEPGDDGRDPRLQEIDLRTAVFRYLVRAVDENGAAINDPGSPLLADVTGPNGQRGHVGFPWRGGQVEFMTPDASVEVTALAAGHRPVRMLLGPGESRLTLKRLQPVELSLPGLRGLLPPDIRVRISLVLDGDTGLPMTDFQALDQRSGRNRGYPRAALGKSTGAGLGGDDKVRMPVMFDGIYAVVMRLSANGMPGEPVSVELGKVTVAAGGGAPAAVSLSPPARVVAAALQEVALRRQTGGR